MLKKLTSEDLPAAAKVNTHSHIRWLLLSFEPDGTARASYQRVKGYQEGGAFVADPTSQEEIGADGIKLPKAFKMEEILSAIDDRRAEIQAKAKAAEAKHKEAEAKRLEADKKQREAEAKAKEAEAMRQQAEAIEREANT